jgi:DNA ligase (NAD+)
LAPPEKVVFLCSKFFLIDLKVICINNMGMNTPRNGTFEFHDQELDFLKKQGFQVNPLNTEQHSIADVWLESKKIHLQKDSLNYPIDGLVVKLNNNTLVEELGVVGKTHRAWSAIKFPADEVTTKITAITWQVGRTGRVTPVAELEAVQLGGTTVQRATLHNAKEVEEKDLHQDDTVIIRKAGEIIPEVVQVLVNIRSKKAQTFPLPIACPSCQTALVRTETDIDLWCSNTYGCNAQIAGRLTYFCQRNIGNISGLSDKIIQKLIADFQIKDIPDLYNLPWAEIEQMEGFGKKSVEKLQLAIEKSKTIEDYKLLAGFAIPGIGPEVAKLILTKNEE